MTTDPSHPNKDRGDPGPSVGAPRWMYALGVGVAVALVVVMVVLHTSGVLGSGSH